MSDCKDLDRQVISFPVRVGGPFSVEGMYPPSVGKGEFRTRSVAVRTEGSDKFKVAGFNREETHQNIGHPVRWTDPCTNRQRFATASYVRGAPCSTQCWQQCYDGKPVNLRGDIPVATRATVTIMDNTGMYVVPIEACYNTDCGYDPRCYGWLGGWGGINCGDCAHVFPSDEPAGMNLADLARWRGYGVVKCANCTEKDIHYSVQAGIDCWINDPIEPCNREYYLWVHVYIQPRTYLRCPPIYSCIESTFDGPLCYDPPQPPPDIDGCSSYRGCVKLDKYEELCGVFKESKTLLLRCAYPSDVEGNCENTCTVLATFSGQPDTGPYCVPCWGTADNPLSCADGMTQDTPRRGVDIAKSLKMVIRSYLSAASATSCCRELIENTEVILESCTQPAGCDVNTESECEPCFIPAEAKLIARWQDVTRSYVVETTDCGKAFVQHGTLGGAAVLLMSAQADIYCWPSDVGAVTTCYGVRVIVCIATSIDSEDECCSEAGTVHCMQYVGCAELSPLEQCGANGRFWDIIEPIIVELTCAENPNCAPCTMQVELTTNENLLQ